MASSVRERAPARDNKYDEKGGGNGREGGYKMNLTM
jgi:hypothetical protein